MKLYIDSIDPKIVKLILDNNKEKKIHKFTAEYNLSEILPVEIEKFLQKQKIKLHDIDNIDVAPGPGGFSRVRTAVAVVNALNFALNSKTFKLVKPIYSKEPNISKPKRKIPHVD